MQDKRVAFNKLWHSDEWVSQHVVGAAEFEYEKHIRSMHRFEGNHPAPMTRRVKAMNWSLPSIHPTTDGP